MGYTTTFSGVLTFTTKLAPGPLAYLETTFLGTDGRDHPEWKAEYGELTHFDFCLTGDKDGIEWDGSEKFYHAVEKANLIIKEMKKLWPNFGLKGQMEAQGEEIGDVWTLRINPETGLAEEIRTPKLGEHIRCPHCKKQFELDGTRPGEK